MTCDLREGTGMSVTCHDSSKRLLKLHSILQRFVSFFGLGQDLWTLRIYLMCGLVGRWLSE